MGQDCCVCYPSNSQWSGEAWTVADGAEYVQLKLVFNVLINPSDSTGKDLRKLMLAYVQYFDKFAESRGGYPALHPRRKEKVIVHNNKEKFNY